MTAYGRANDGGCVWKKEVLVRCCVAVKRVRYIDLPFIIHLDQEERPVTARCSALDMIFVERKDAGHTSHLAKEAFPQRPHLEILPVLGLIDHDGEGFSVVKESSDAVRNAMRMLQFAKAMLISSKTVIMPHNGQPASIRIGLHTGDCVTGLVGSKLPKFSVFGEC